MIAECCYGFAQIPAATWHRGASIGFDRDRQCRIRQAIVQDSQAGFRQSKGQSIDVKGPSNFRKGIVEL